MAPYSIYSNNPHIYKDCKDSVINLKSVEMVLLPHVCNGLRGRIKANYSPGTSKGAINKYSLYIILD